MECIGTLIQKDTDALYFYILHVKTEDCSLGQNTSAKVHGKPATYIEACHS